MKRMVAATGILSILLAMNAGLFSGLSRAEAPADGAAVSRVDPLVYDFEWYSTPPDGTVYNKPETAGWTAAGGVEQATAVENSDWILTVTGTSFSVLSEERLALEASLYPSFRVNLKNGSAAKRARLFFTTGEGESFSSAKSVQLPIRARAPLYQEYLFDLSGIAAWSGMIYQVKIEFSNEEGDSAADGTVRIDYFSFNPDCKPAELLFDFSKGLQGMQNFQNTDHALSSLLTLTPAGAGASFDTVPDLNLPASQMNFVKISLQNATSAKKIRVSFLTATSKIWNEEKSVEYGEMAARDSGQRVYAFNMTKSAAWKGTIEQLRITFEDTKSGDGSISIPLLSVSPEVYLKEETLDFSAGAAGWSAGLNVSVTHTDGAMRVSLLGSGGAVSSPALSLNADGLRYLKLRLKNNTKSTAMKIQWINGDNSFFDEIRTQNIVIKPNAPMQEYLVPIGDHQRWEGTVTALRITPALSAASGSVDIQSLTFSQHEEAAFVNRQVSEGPLEHSVLGWSKNQNGGQIAGTEAADDKVGTTAPSVVGGTGGDIELVNNGPDNTLQRGQATEAWRSLPIYGDGFIQWPVTVTVNNAAAAGNSIRLINTQTGNDAVRITLDNGKAQLALPGGEKREIGVVGTNSPLKFMLYMNMSAHTYDLWVAGKRAAADLAFTNPESFDKLYLGTTGQSKVIMGYTGGMYRINEVYDDFAQLPAGALDSDAYTAGGTPFIGGNTVSGTMTPPANGSSSPLSISGAGTFVRRDFEARSNVIESNVKFAVMERSDGLSITLRQGGTAVARIASSGNDFVLLKPDGSEQVLWKNYRTKVYYVLKVRIYTELKKMEYSINGSASKNGGMENQNTPLGFAMPAGTTDVDNIYFENAAAGIMFVDSIHILDYTPSTVPAIEATNDPENGLIGSNGWVSNVSNDRFYQKSQRLADKESVLGYFDDYNRESANWQMKYLAENGIDFLSYFYIGLGPMAVDTYTDYADYKNYIRFAYQIDGGWAANAAGQYENLLYPVIAERYFRNPNYIRYNGAPILFIYGNNSGNNILNWDAQTAQNLKNLAKADGFTDLILINVVNSDIPETEFAYSKAAGFDYVSQYWKISSPSALDKYYAAGAKNKIDFIASPGTGADSRCWSTLEQTASPYPYIYMTPSAFYRVLDASKKALLKYSGQSLAGKMVLTENWGELGEGHGIMPFGEYGFGYVNQIRRVFGNQTDNNYKNTKPSGKLDLLYPKGWNEEQLLNRGFESGKQYWEGVRTTVVEKASKEFHYLKGALTATARGGSDSYVVQDVTNQILRGGKGAVYNMSAYVEANSSTYQAPDDTTRYFSFFPLSDRQAAMTYTEMNNKGVLVANPYQEGNDRQKFVTKKVPGFDEYYQIFVAEGYREDSKGRPAAGKLVITINDQPDDRTYLLASLEVWDFGRINETNERDSWFRLDREIYEGDTIAIRAGINYSERALFETMGASIPVRQVIDWNGTTQRWIAAYRAPTEKPKAFRTSSYLELEITDDAGVHTYRYDGASTLFSSIINMAEFQVSWTGALKKALFKVCGDSATAETFLIDECRLQLVPKQYLSAAKPMIVGGVEVADHGPDSGSEEEAIIIENVVNNKNGDIVIELSNPIILSSAVFKAAKEHNVTVTFLLKDAQRLWYSWTFRPEDLIRTDVDFNTRVSFVSLKKYEIDKAMGKADSFYFSYAHTGPMPGKAAFRAYTGEKYEPSSSLNLYAFQAKTKTLQARGALTSDRDGYVSFDISVISEMVLNTDTPKPKPTPNPSTGDAAANLTVALLFAALLLGTLRTRRRWPSTQMKGAHHNEN